MYVAKYLCVCVCLFYEALKLYNKYEVNPDPTELANEFPFSKISHSTRGSYHHWLLASSKSPVL